jgi:hypothetical protein
MHTQNAISFKMVCALIGLTAASGCAVDICGRAKKVNEQFHQRHAQCFAQGTLELPFNTEACSSSMNACTEPDHQALESYLNCLEQLEVCTPETRTAFAQEVLSCASPMVQLTRGCFQQ